VARTEPSPSLVCRGGLPVLSFFFQAERLSLCPRWPFSSILKTSRSEYPYRRFASFRANRQ